MEPVERCFLLPVDGTDEALRPVAFIEKLYGGAERLRVILSYIVPPLPPLYDDPREPDIIRKKGELLAARDTETRSVLDRARARLLKAGFPEGRVQEQVQERAASRAKQTCFLADIKKVDAVLVQKRVSSALEGFLKGDATPDFLHHCEVSPLWLIDGNVDTTRAAVCVLNEDASLRVVDHAAFMLAETSTRLVLLHAARSVGSPLAAEAGEVNHGLEAWFRCQDGRPMEPYLKRALAIARDAGIPDERIETRVVPCHGNVAVELLSFCRREKIGIVALGHSKPGGAFSFLKASVTRKILGEFKDMAVWVNQ